VPNKSFKWLFQRLVFHQVEGVAFKKTFSYAGFEMQKKQYDSPKIAMLNIELVNANGFICSEGHQY
jgi:hypothetical protein